MDTITNQQTINNAHNIPFMTHAFLIRERPFNLKGGVMVFF